MAVDDAVSRDLPYWVIGELLILGAVLLAALGNILNTVLSFILKASSFRFQRDESGWSAGFSVRDDLPLGTPFSAWRVVMWGLIVLLVSAIMFQVVLPYLQQQLGIPTQ